jgi:hypothetical protein
MLRKIPLLLLLISSSALAQKGCELLQNEASMGFEQSRLSGSLQDGKDGTKLDIKNDLGISKSETGIKAMFNKSTTHHKFGFKLEKYQHSGSKKLSSNIIYNGAQYATASLINSKVSLRWAKAKYRYRPTADFALGTDLDLLRLKTMVNDEETKKTIIMPALALEYEHEIEEGLSVVAKGSSSFIGSSKQYYAYTGLAYDLRLLGCSCLHLGYQYKKLDIQEDNINADLKYQGLYAGISMKF